MKNILRLIGLAILTGYLCGCSLFSVQTGPVNTYILDRVPNDIPVRARHKIIMGVTAPTALPLYNTTDIIYSTTRYQVASFSKSSWVATPPQMLEPLLVKTLENTHYFFAVKTTTMGRADYLLNTEILELLHDFKQTPSVVRVRIRADIVNATTNQLVKTKEFYAEEPALQPSPYGGVVAANHAVENILSQIAWFTLTRQR